MHISQVINIAAVEGLVYWLDDKTGVERITFNVQLPVECIDKALVWDATTNCDNGHDVVDCFKRPGDFQCPINKLCISAALLCDGWNCADGADDFPHIFFFHGGACP
ncbi:GL20286 [Drosophila persimilis]|uniref:GL20286 n=1 Tax=Drosophila persimilis TaxID=7234 RepID=B4GXI8_DROPE|nr:GL20286 [Drosophila persimilis]